MLKTKDKKKRLARERKIIFIIMLAAIATAFILLSSLSMALAAEASYCCEKTTDGKWCQNTQQSQCDPAFKNAPTSCESTSYCKPGCCFNEVEGTCMESTPQRVCQDSNGIWAASQQCQIPQCNLGCCILGDQGAFITLTRCKMLSGFYQLNTDFRTTITDEATCIATAQQADKGACVTESSGVKNCVFETRASCSTASQSSENVNITELNSTGNITMAPVGFYKDTLCTAPELGSICGRSQKTTLIEGKDEVYYTDTCGNIANIYDASRFADNQYWEKVYKKSESCGYGSSNAGSATCGNCDYFLGSIGRKASSSTGLPTYGDNICIDLSCKDAGKRHGESWCNDDNPTGNGQDTVGSRYYKEVCIFGEVIPESCADFRNEICIQDTFNGFSEAACRVNRWQDCIGQKDQAACENADVRDCLWREGYYYSSNTAQIEKSNNDTSKGQLTPDGLCLPNYPPGLTFWGSTSTTTSSGLTTGTTGTSGNFSSTTPAFTGTTPAFGTGYVSPSSTGGTGAVAQCALGNAKLSVQFTRVTYPLKIFGQQKTEWTCDQSVGNCQYVTAQDIASTKISDESAKNWASAMNEFCANLGDCGEKSNYVGVSTDQGYAAYHGQQRVAGSGGPEIIEATPGANGTTTASSASSSASTNTAANIAQVTQASTGVVNTIAGKAVAPIQGRVIMDYFKNLWAGGK